MATISHTTYPEAWTTRAPRALVGEALLSVRAYARVVRYDTNIIVLSSKFLIMFIVSGIGFVACTWLSLQKLRTTYYLILIVLRLRFRVLRFQSVKLAEFLDWLIFHSVKPIPNFFVESERFVRINMEWWICWLSNVSFKFNAQSVIYH